MNAELLDPSVDRDFEARVTPDPHHVGVFAVNYYPRANRLDDAETLTFVVDVTRIPVTAVSINWGENGGASASPLTDSLRRDAIRRAMAAFRVEVDRRFSVSVQASDEYGRYSVRYDPRELQQIRGANGAPRKVPTSPKFSVDLRSNPPQVRTTALRGHTLGGIEEEWLKADALERVKLEARAQSR